MSISVSKLKIGLIIAVFAVVLIAGYRLYAANSERQRVNRIQAACRQATLEDMSGQNESTENQRICDQRRPTDTIEL